MNNNEITFADVAANLTAIASEQRFSDRQTRDAQRAESARLDARRAAWAAANGIPVDADLFAAFG